MKYIKAKKQNTSNELLDTIYNLQSPPISMSVYSPLLWRIAKGQSRLIKGWSLWSRTSSIHHWSM